MNLITLNKHKRNNTSYNIIIVCISFKLTNIFVTISKFTKFFGFFLLDKLLYTFSCGQQTIRGPRNKLNTESYNMLIKHVTYFLWTNNLTKVHFMIKSSRKINYMFIKKLINMLTTLAGIKIISLHINIATPFNGCRLQKRKF